MSWIMKAKKLNIDYISVYGGNKKYMNIVEYGINGR